MPKKHTPAYTTTKPNYVHPSLQSSRATASSASTSSPSPQTVNDRIAHLRREQAPRATAEQRDDMTLLVSSRTVPPELRRILHIPEVNAPKPKVGTRTPRMRGPGVTRPPPGPAAPVSWLYMSRHAPTKTRFPSKQRMAGGASPGLGLLARQTGEDLQRIFPRRRSLQHTCLRTFAEHWVDLSEYEQHYIPTLNILMREALLSYLTIYGEEECLGFASFKILFQNAGDNWDDVRFLDLTGLLNNGFTVNDLHKCLRRADSQATQRMGTLSIDSHDEVKGKTKLAAIADSWEDEVDDDAEHASEPLPAQLITPHFTNLTRLSLAHAGRWASWLDLVKLSPALNKLTHLSLAYWPRPTLTPNSASTSMVAKHTRLAFSGTSHYADLDDDYQEAANILRRFSVNTYSLEWLDLEGCGWLKALTWQDAHPATPPSTPPHPTNGWTETGHLPHPHGPNWNGAWQRITYINMFQGWIPGHEKTLQNMPGGVVAMQVMRWLRERSDQEKDKVDDTERGQGVANWIEKEKGARSVADVIKARRKKGEGRWCQVDFGWGLDVGGGKMKGQQ